MHPSHCLSATPQPFEPRRGCIILINPNMAVYGQYNCLNVQNCHNIGGVKPEFEYKSLVGYLLPGTPVGPINILRKSWKPRSDRQPEYCCEWMF